MGKPEKENKKGLKRHLGIFSVFAICTGAAFSSGFFLLPGMAAEMSGPSLPLAYLVAAILMLPAILSISELSAAMPRSGGPYFFVTRSFGPLLGMIGALGKFVQLLLKGAFAFVGVGIYLSVLLDVPTQLVAIVLIVLFTLVNLLGVRQTATTEKILVVVLLVILTYFVVSGITEITAGRVNFEEEFLPMLPSGWGGFFSTVAFVFISFGGVAQVASVAEEVKDPARSFPKGILYSLGVSTFFYLAGTFIMLALLSSASLQGDQTPVVTAARQITTLPMPVVVVVIAALAAFASTGNAAILSASRYPLALSRDKLFWGAFGKVSNKGIPKQAVLLSGGLSVCIILFLNVEEIAKIASAFLLFVFLSMCLAVIIFRESGKKDYNPEFRSPLYPWLHIIGSFCYIWLIWESGPKAIVFILGIILAGFLWYKFEVKEKPHFSAAIFPMFQRLAQQEKTGGKTTNIALSFEASNLPATVEDADFIDLDEEITFEKAVDKAAEALAHRLGGKREKLADILHEEVDHWKNPTRFNISVAPILLNGIEQPHMVIIRGEISLGEDMINGLIVVADDNKYSNRLLKLVGQLEIAILHADFPDKWEKAKNAEEIKLSISQTLRSFSISVIEEGPTAELIGSDLTDIDLPDQTVIGAVYREGKIMADKEDISIKEGDEIIFITQGKAFEQLYQRFSSETTSI